MKISKPTENWTKMPNCILDNIDKYTPAEFKILGLMVRKNLGYQKPNKQFSLSYICLKTKMAKETVNKAVKGLLGKGSIIIADKGKRGIHLYDICWVEPLSQKLDQSKNKDTSIPEIEPDLSQESNSLKENIVLKNKVEENPEAKASPSYDKEKHKEIVKIFYEKYQEIYKEKLDFNDKRYKKEMGCIVNMNGYPLEDIKRKAIVLEYKCRDIRDTFHIFVPSMLLSQWIKLVGKPEPKRIHPDI